MSGSWQQILADTREQYTGLPLTVPKSPADPVTNNVFDWRVGVTALAAFMSEYTQIYALTDPNYTSDNTWDTIPGGMQDLRLLLEKLYSDMAAGVHAGYLCTNVDDDFDPHDQVWCDGNHLPQPYAGPGFTISSEAPVPPGWTINVYGQRVQGGQRWTATIGAADINTGIQAVTSNVMAADLSPSCVAGMKATNGTTVGHFIVPDPSCLDAMKNNALSLVYSKMPLTDLRATIDALADLEDAPVEMDRLPAGTIADCQAVADQYGIMQNSSWGFANSTALQAQWQASGCHARASWLDAAWALRSSRALDYDGDGKADFAVWRPDNSGWRPLSGQVNGAPSLGRSFQVGNGLDMFYRTNSSDWSRWNSSTYGYNTDVPIPGYYEGPGHAIQEAVWRPSNGAWYIRDSSGDLHTFNWGGQGNIPLPADYDGDGIDDLTVWDPSSGNWYTFPSGGYGPYNYYYNSYWVQQWGQLGDTPVPADYDGDGIADRAYWRPTEGNWYILGTTGSNPTVQWGQIGDIPVPGNYEGLGTDLAVFRPTEGKFYILNHDRTAGWWVGWGQQGDIPVPGDYDGDGKTDFAVFRPSNGTWYWINSSNWTGDQVQYGETGDVPLP